MKNNYNTKKLTLGFFLAVTMLAGSTPLGFSEPLRVQLEQGIDANDIQCDDDSHVLMLRPNANLSCVSFHTGYTLLDRDWVTTEPIYTQMKTYFEDQFESQKGALERAPARNTIEFLKENQVLHEITLQQTITSKTNEKTALLIPKYLPSYYELKLHTKPSNMDSTQVSYFWYLPKDVDIETLEFENDLLKVGGIKIFINKESHTQDKIDSIVEQRLSVASSKVQISHEKIGGFDAVITTFNNPQHQIHLYNENYSIYLVNLFLPKSEIEKVILSLGDNYE